MELVNSRGFNILVGDCIEKLKELPDGCVDTCITSPPYYGLRDYGTGEWVGGDPNCNHYRDSKTSEFTITGHKNMSDLSQPVGDAIYKTMCPKCGAIRVDRQIGLEETPEMYIERLVSVFREVKRVLKDDGTLWVNIGDSYNSTPTGSIGRNAVQRTNRGSLDRTHSKHMVDGCKQKDLIGIPWMLAFALRNDGWYLRQDIIWAKKNPMPESVKDRCTKSHEYIFLLSKSSKYYFDSDAIQERAVTNEHRPSGVERERLFDYNSKKNLYPESYLVENKTYGKYKDKDEESLYRQGMNRDRGNGIILKRYNLPEKDIFINFIKSANIIDEVIKLGIKKTTVEHWIRKDDYFAYPSIEDWELCKQLFSSMDNFDYIDSCLSDVTYETDAINKAHTGIKFGGNKYSKSKEMEDFRIYSGNEYISTGYRNKRDVWFVGTKPFKGAHFATFPEELITPCILAGSRKGGIVLDPFSGSGTTGVACVHNDRKYIGTELNSEYADMSMERLNAETCKNKLW